MANLSSSERLEALKGHYSDLHKEVHGFRPRGSWIMASTNPRDIVFIRDEIDRLCVDGERAAALERSCDPREYPGYDWGTDDGDYIDRRYTGRVRA